MNTEKIIQLLRGRSECITPQLKRYYKVLGVGQDASGASVERAYQNRAFEVNPGQFYYDNRLRTRAEELLQEIEEAHEKVIAHIRERKQILFPWVSS